MPVNFINFEKAGDAGPWSVYLIFFGIFLLVAGVEFLELTNDQAFQGEFFQDGHRYKLYQCINYKYCYVDYCWVCCKFQNISFEFFLVASQN